MWDWINKLQELKERHIPVAVVTVIDTAGSAPRDAGTKMFVLKNQEIYGTIGGGNLEKLVITQATTNLIENINGKYIYNLGAKAGQCCGGVVEVFIEVINNNAQLIIFGAGHVAQAIAHTMDETPFCIHLIDERLSYDQKLLKSEMPHSTIIHQTSWQETYTKILLNKIPTYIVIMTHSHQLDEDILKFILTNEENKFIHYIGLIGSETKWSRFKKRLIEQGIPLEKISKIKCPIGFKIGGKAPKEVAISLAAELIELYYKNQN